VGSNTHYVRFPAFSTITTIIIWRLDTPKKLVLTLSTEGKKWSLRYHYTHIRGKKWGKMFKPVDTKRWERDYPHHRAWL